MQLRAVVQINEMGARNVESRKQFNRLFDTYWDDVQHLNSYSPEAARALLRLQGTVPASATAVVALADGADDFDNIYHDPWMAVRAGLQERAAGRVISRNA